MQAQLAQEEACKLRDNVGAMDLEIEDLRRQLAAQSNAAGSRPAESTAADVFSEGAQIIMAAKVAVDEVISECDATSALAEHVAMMEEHAKQLQEYSVKMVAFQSSPRYLLALAEMLRQEAVSQLVKKEAQISGWAGAGAGAGAGGDTARSNLSNASAQLTARSSEHSALTRSNKEASWILEQEKTKLQDIITEEEELSKLEQTGSAVERQAASQKKKELADKKDEASQKVEKQQVKNDGFYINNDQFCMKNDEICI